MATNISTLFTEYDKCIREKDKIHDEIMATERHHSSLLKKLEQFDQLIESLRNSIVEGKIQSGSNSAYSIANSPAINKGLLGLITENNIDEGYGGQSWSNTRKLVHILSRANECMSSSDLVDIIVLLEPNFYTNTELRRSLMYTISSQLGTRWKQRKVFGRFSDKDKLLKYGLIEWFDIDGNVKSEYRPQDS